MSLTVNAFAAMAQQSGNITVQGEGLVHGKGGTWMRSALDIGNSRTENANTLAAFRNAIHSDPRYAKVDELAQAMLGTISPKLPLSSAQVKNVLANLNTAVANNIAQNTGAGYNEIMKLVSQESIQANMAPQELSPKLQSLMTKALGASLIAACGDFSTMPNADNLKRISQDMCQSLSQSLKQIAGSSFDDNTKTILQNSLFEGTTLKSPEAIQANIAVRETRKNTDELAASMVADKGPVQNCLLEKLNDAKLAQKMPAGSALDSLKESISDSIKKAGKMGTHVVTHEQAMGIVQAKVEQYTQAMQTAAQLPNKAEGDFVQGYLQNINGAMPASFIQSTVEHSQGINLGQLAKEQAFSSPMQMMNFFISMASAANKYGDIPENMRPEGNLGRQNYMDILLGSALARANFTPAQMDTFYEQICNGTGKELHSLINSAAPSAERTTVLSFMEILQHRAGTIQGFSPDIIANDFQAPINSFLEMSEIPGYSALPNPEDRLDKYARTMADSLKTTLFSEMHKSVRNELTTFDKDITRGLNINLGGVQLWNAAQLKDVQLPEGVMDTTENRQEQLRILAHDAVTAFISDDPGATFATAKPEIQNQVCVLTTLLSQETENPALIAIGKSTIKNYGSECMLLFVQESQRDFHVEKLSDGTISICYNASMSVSHAMENSNILLLNADKSYNSASLGFTISADQLTMLGNQDWKNAPRLGSDEALPLTPANIPENFSMNFAGLQLSGKISLVSD